MKRVKIADVARQAGVSTATVDRVLNGRPGVRKETVEIVHRELERLGYSATSLAARNWGTPKANPLDFVALVPSGHNPFLDKLTKHLAQAGLHSDTIGVTLRLRRVDILNIGDFLSALDDIRDERPDGVIIVSMDTAETRDAIDGLVAEGIQVVTLITDVPHSRRGHYVGSDNVAAGRTAGCLMARWVKNNTGTVGVVVGDLGLRDHFERRSGFEQALAGICPDISIDLSAAVHDDAQMAEAAVSKLIERVPDLVGIYNVAATNDGTDWALTKLGRGNLIVISHELTPRSRKNLVSGLYDAVIAQDYRYEAETAVNALVSLCRGDLKYRDLRRVAINIFIKDNLP